MATDENGKFCVDNVLPFARADVLAKAKKWARGMIDTRVLLAAVAELERAESRAEIIAQSDEQKPRLYTKRKQA
jgi:hypothetical protein